MLLAYLGLGVAVSCAVISLLVVHYQRSLANTLWGLFCMSISLWGAGLYLSFSTFEYALALLFVRSINYIAILIPLFFLHFSFSYVARSIRETYKLVPSIAYGFSLILLVSCIVFPELYIPSVEPKYWFDFYPSAGPLFYVFTIYFFLLAGLGFWFLLQHRKLVLGREKLKVDMIVWPVFIGFLGNSTTFPLLFDIPVYPLGIVLSIVSAGFVSMVMMPSRFFDLPFMISIVAGKLLTVSLLFSTYFVLFLVSKQIPDPTFLIILSVPITYIWASEFETVSTVIKDSLDSMLTGSNYCLDEAVNDIRSCIMSYEETYAVLNGAMLRLQFWLNFSEGQFYLIDNYLSPSTESRGYQLVTSPASTFRQTSLDKNDPIILELKNKKIALNRSDYDINNKDAFQKHHCEIMAPILISEEMVGIFQISEKTKGRFSAKDYKLINTVILIIQKYLKVIKSHDEFKKVSESAQKTASLMSMMNLYNHELKNIFVPASMRLDIYKDLKDDGKDQNYEEIFNDIYRIFKDSRERSETLISRMITVVKGDHEGAMAKIDLETYVAETIEAYGIKGFELELDFVPTPLILADKLDLEVLVLNIMINASQALEDFDHIRYLQELKLRSKIKVSSRLSEAEETVFLRFEDNGPGIPENVLESWKFEKSISTKQHGNGVGFLAIKNIVHNHGWKMKFGNLETVGAYFEIAIPIDKEDLNA